MPVRQFSAPAAGHRQAAGPSARRSPRRSRRSRAQAPRSPTSRPTLVPSLASTPERQDALDFRVELIARRAVAGDAVAHHAAELVVRLEDRDRVALAAQEIGRREAGGAAADHGDFLARIGAPAAGSAKLVLDRPIADILLDRVDADEVVDLVAVAAVLARRRADAAHHRRERIGFDHALEGVFLPRHAGDRRLVHAARDGEPAANVVPRRAAALAGRRAMDIGRALVGAVRLEDLFGQVGPIPHASCRSRSGGRYAPGGSDPSVHRPSSLRLVAARPARPGQRSCSILLLASIR